MNIIILGVGSLGTYLANALSKEKHNVTVVDRDERALDAFAKNADVATICGWGGDWKLLQQLLEYSPDMLVAMTGNDETNLTASFCAKKLGYPLTVVKVSSPSYLDQSRIDFMNCFEINSLIAPEVIVSHDLFDAIIHTGAIASDNFINGKVQMRTFVIPDSWEHQGKTLNEINLQDARVGMIYRKEFKDNRFILPKSDDKLIIGDEVTFFGTSERIIKLAEELNAAPHKIGHVTIGGGSIAALHLAHALHDQGIEVKILDKDESRCRELADELPFATILNHDPADLNFLIGEKIYLTDIFVSCSESTEKNILTATLAQDAGCPAVVTLVSDTSYGHLLKRLGITYVISEKQSVTNHLLAMIYGEAATALTTLYAGRIKIIEKKLTPETLKLPSNTILCATGHEDTISFIPPDTLQENDTVLLLQRGEF